MASGNPGMQSSSKSVVWVKFGQTGLGGGRPGQRSPWVIGSLIGLKNSPSHTYESQVKHNLG